MSILLGDNFQFLGSKPLDARLKYDTVAAMKAMADSTLYDGCLAYCTATDKTYQWKSTNTVDTTLGKWREFSSVVVDSAIDSTSENPVQNKVIKTALDGKADLVDGKIPASQLPSYVDDVIDGYYKTADGKFYEESTYETEITPESGKIYISVDTDIQYRWTGSAYSPLGGALTLGETSSTAYRGDRGKTAYDISQTVGDVANLTTTNKSSVVAAINEVKANGLALGETSTTAYRGDRGKTAYDFSQNPSTSNPAMNGTATAGSSTAWSRGDHVHPKDTSKQDVLQYSTMPTAAAGNAGKIIQYIGTTTVTYKNGYFYKCVESSGSYIWKDIDVQGGGADGEVFRGTSAEWNSLTTSEKEGFKIVVIQQGYPIELTVGDQYTINGKTFKVAEDLGDGVYAMQANSSWGKAVWPGYSAAGGSTSTSFVNQSIAPYFTAANTWYNNAVKSMEADDYKYGPYLISSEKAQLSYKSMNTWNCGGAYVSAMKDFAGTDSNRVWIGTASTPGYTYCISNTYANLEAQTESFCIAPAFNVDTKKVKISNDNVITPLGVIGGDIYVYNPTTGNLEVRGSAPYASNPKMNGNASPGTSNNYARGDHVHPSDTTRLSTSGDGSNVTAAFTAASSRANITTGEKLSVIFGKIAKFFTDLKAVAFSGSYNDLSNKLTAGNNISISSGNVITANASGSLVTNYTTTEQIIGTWVDGSTLYMKTVSIGTLPNNTTKTVNHGISNVSKIWPYDGWTHNPSEGRYLPLPCAASSSAAIAVSCSSTAIMISTSMDRRSYTTSYVTVLYTKTS